MGWAGDRVGADTLAGGGVLDEGAFADSTDAATLASACIEVHASGTALDSAAFARSPGLWRNHSVLNLFGCCLYIYLRVAGFPVAVGLSTGVVGARSGGDALPVAGDV